MSALALVLLGLLGARWWAAQDLLCAQTDAISDACYSLGVGHRPSREERLAWAKVSPRDCYDLKLFLRKYPSGVLAGRAEAAMVAPRVHWARRTTHLEGRVGEGATFPSKRGAAADSWRRADEQADRDCVAPTGARGKAAGVLIIDYATPPPPERSPMQCGSIPGGWVCAFKYYAECSYLVPETMPNCGTPGPDTDDED